VDIALLLVRLVLAGVFAVSGVAKLADRAGSRQAMTDFGVPAPLAAPFGLLLPLAELAVAVTLLPAATAWWGALGALTLLLLFVGGISFNLARGRKPDCRCFGQLRSAPVGWSTLARNAILAALAGLVVWRGYGAAGAGPGALSWLGGLSAAGLLGLLFGLIVLGLLGIQGWFLLHLLRQNGRLMVRLRALETRLGGAAPATSENASGNGVHPAVGLPVGSVAPTFSLPDLRGEEVTLESLRAAGKPVLLFFTSPSCGYCTDLLPEVARWQEEHAEKLTIALVSHNSAEENRAKVAEHGVGPVLLQDDWEVSEAYDVEAAPSAQLVRPDGTIGSPLVEGPDSVENLVAEVVEGRVQLPMLHSNGGGHAAHGEAVPAPPNVGESAPEVGLQDLEGRVVSLADFRGEETLLLFWSPSCGHCQNMLPDLKEWEANPPKGAPELIVVSDGTVEDNREQGLSSRVVLDQGYRVSDAFGAQGTPSAVLVDAEGRVASTVVGGAPAVLQLAGAGRPRTRR
jgi:methylamine dehydrogenase accessory protein MauD